MLALAVILALVVLSGACLAFAESCVEAVDAITLDAASKARVARDLAERRAVHATCLPSRR
jgi:hypothetical protein